MTMKLREARKIAEAVEVDQIDPATWPAQRDSVSQVFHKLDMSDPATVELRREDMRLARIIMREVGNATGIPNARI